MEFQSTIESYRSQLKFYQILSLVFATTVGIEAVLFATQKGPYFVRENDSFSVVTQSEPWRLTTERIEGFLRLYLDGRMHWSKEDFDSKKALLSAITSETVQTKLKDSLVAFGAMARNQDMRSFYVLEGHRFSNEKKIVEAQVSRIIRIGATGVVTPIQLVITYDEAAVTEQNPYGLKIVSIDESEIKTTADSKADRGSASN